MTFFFILNNTIIFIFSKETDLTNTHFTISAGMPHRKILRQLAEKHREEECQKQKLMEEYPNDFEEEQEEEEKRKKNLFDLVKICKNQLTFNNNKFEMKLEG